MNIKHKKKYGNQQTYNSSLIPILSKYATFRQDIYRDNGTN